MNSNFKHYLTKIIEQVGMQLIQIISLIILARILSPNDYGVMAIALGIILTASVILQNGLNMAIIQKQDISHDHYNSVYTFNIFLSISIYILFFFSAPSIETWIEIDNFAYVFRTLGLIVLLMPYISIQTAYMNKTLNFRESLIINYISTLISVVISILLAINSLGIWSLVAQYITQHIIQFLLLKMKINLQIKFVFSKSHFLDLFSFSWKLTLTYLIDSFYKNIQSIIIGKLYSPNMVGFLQKGEQLPALVSGSIANSISAVSFPLFSKIQNDKEKLNAGIFNITFVVIYFITPTMLIFLMYGSEIITLVFTEKWIGMVNILQVYCIIYLIRPLYIVGSQAINAIGRSDLYLKIEMVRKGLGFLILFFTLDYGILFLLFGFLVVEILSVTLNLIMCHKIFNLNWIEQLKILIVSAITALFAIYFIKFIGINTGFSLIDLILNLLFIYILYLGLSINGVKKVKKIISSL